MFRYRKMLDRSIVPLAAVALSTSMLASTGCASTAYAQQARARPASRSWESAAPASSTAPPTFSVPDLAERVKPSVVNITTTVKAPLARGDLRSIDPFDLFDMPGARPEPTLRGQGSGFIIDPAGYVVTNEHVVRDAAEVRVRLADEREFVADVVGRDPKLDVALLELRGATNLPVAKLGSSEQLRVGDSVVAIGNPFGLGHTVTLGIVSAKARAIGAGPYDDFIQTDASINPGNSGGPLLNGRGEVVGINTVIHAGGNGIGFAIPSDAVKEVLPQLREKGYVERGKLGLRFQSITAELAKAMGVERSGGALVAEVEPGGPAARAGLRSGDIIVAINGKPIAHAEELARNVARNRPGSRITVTVLRQGHRQDLSAVLDKLDDADDNAARRSPGVRAPTSQSAEPLGIQASNARDGVRVDAIPEGAEGGELMPGDIVQEVAGTRVTTVDAFRAAIAKAPPGSTVLVKVRRGDTTRFAAIEIPAKK